MKISFLIPAIVLYTVRVAFSNSVQVGTVLFTTTDLVRKCWTDYDKSLLKARAIMQDVLPDPDCLDFSNPEAIVILLDYFHACYQIISTSTYGKVQNLMYVALSDAFGGYLRAHVLPFTKRSYYAGLVKYSEAQKLFLLYDDIKAFLKTDGRGWATPPNARFRAFRVKPLVITGGTAEACKDLYIIEKEGKEHFLNANGGTQSLAEDYPMGHEEMPSWDYLGGLPKGSKFQPFSKSVVFAYPWNGSQVMTWMDESELNDGTNCSLHSPKCEKTAPKVGKGKPEDQDYDQPRIKTVVVPLPVLDDQDTPNSIAVPFKKRPFRNLKTGSSANVLEYYYTSVIKCFLAKGNSRTDIKDFNGRFHSWLVCKVLPHLGEEQWYPGFGGVLRVIETIKMLGADNSFKDPCPHDYGFLFDEGSEFEVDPSFLCKGKYKARDVFDVAEGSPPMKRNVVTFILIVSVLVFIFCTGCLIYLRAPKDRRALMDVSQEPNCYQKQEDNFFNSNIMRKFNKFKKTGTVASQPELPPVFECQNVSAKLSAKCAKHDPRHPQDWAYGDAQGYQRQHETHFCTHKTRFPYERRPHNVHTLWKKPSNRYWTSGYDMDVESRRHNSTVSLTGSEGRSSSCSAAVEDETKCYSTEVRTMTCNCTGSCHCTVLTDSSAITKEKKRKSSTVTIFDRYDEAIRKQNSSTKSSTQCSTAESGSEGFCSSECSTCFTKGQKQ